MATATTASRNGKANGSTNTAVKDTQGEATAALVIDQIEVETLKVPILGTSPLIVNRFSEKAKRQMLDAMQGRKTPKTPKDPEAEYNAARYRFPDGTDGFPVVGFKAATVSAANFYGRDVTKVMLRQSVFMRGDLGNDGLQLVPLGTEPEMREDVVRVNRGGSDMRYRPEYWPWSTTLTVIYVKSALTRESILSLIDAGGMGVGVGEWRPERNGDMGTYRIDPDREIEFIGDPR